MKHLDRIISIGKELKQYGFTSDKLNEMYLENTLTLNEKEIEDKWLHVLITNKENMRWTE